jgi:hypothetical protein
MVVRAVEEKAAEDDGYRKLADKLRDRSLPRGPQ